MNRTLPYIFEDMVLALTVTGKDGKTDRKTDRKKDLISCFLEDSGFFKKKKGNCTFDIGMLVIT